MVQSDTASLYKKAFILSIITIAYNIIEGVVSAYFGYSDETLALFGFGIDSFIEVVSGIGIAHMILRFKKNNFTVDDSFEKLALKITGASFYMLATGLIITVILNTVQKHSPETTFWGIVISAVSIITMTILMKAKMSTGKALMSEPIIADAGCTKVCLYMSVILLISSAVYEMTGFAFIDSLGAAGLAFYSLREGKECFEKARGESSCTCGSCH